jgi:hypothetical protein
VISHATHPVEWVLFVDELDEARQHLEALIQELVANGACEEDDFRIHLGHVYAHLNRAWHSRAHEGEMTDELWPVFSQFPKDLKPVG